MYVPPLPDTNDSLCEVVDRGGIEKANEKVKAVLKAGKGLNMKCYYINTIPLGARKEGKHSPYLKAKLIQKALVAQHTAENRVASNLTFSKIP